MKIAITGHTNIEKAVGMDLYHPNGLIYNDEAFKKVYRMIDDGMSIYKNATIISGMARGVDELFAFYAIKNKLPLILSVPNSVAWHKNRDLSRNMRAQAVFYDEILKYNNLTIFEIKKDYNRGNYLFANFARNQHMVDIADGVLCFKSYKSSGTDDCIKRAKNLNKFLGNLYIEDGFDEW